MVKLTFQMLEVVCQHIYPAHPKQLIEKVIFSYSKDQETYDNDSSKNSSDNVCMKICELQFKLPSASLQKNALFATLCSSFKQKRIQEMMREISSSYVLIKESFSNARRFYSCLENGDDITQTIRRLVQRR